MLTVQLQICVFVENSLLYLNRLWAEVILKPTLRQRFSLIATEIHGMTLLLYFEAFSLSVHELLTTLLRQTKNYQQATNELLLIGATINKANK